MTGIARMVKAMERCLLVFREELTAEQEAFPFAVGRRVPA